MSNQIINRISSRQELRLTFGNNDSKGPGERLKMAIRTGGSSVIPMILGVPLILFDYVLTCVLFMFSIV